MEFELSAKNPLRVHHVAKLLRKPRRTIRHWARSGRLRAFRLGRRAWGFQRDYVSSLVRVQEIYGEEFLRVLDHPQVIEQMLSISRGSAL